MLFKLEPPPEIEAEEKRLYEAWIKLPSETRVSLREYRDAHCSEAAKAYMRECAEIKAQLKPGEYV